MKRRDWDRGRRKYARWQNGMIGRGAEAVAYIDENKHRLEADDREVAGNLLMRWLRHNGQLTPPQWRLLRTIKRKLERTA